MCTSEQRCLCAALLGHAHICVYTRIALDRPVSAQSERDMYKLSAENLYMRIEVYDIRRSPAG